MRDRDNKVFRAGNYYHVFNRGNNKQKIFLDDQDYRIFLNRLEMALGIEKPYQYQTFGQGVPLTLIKGRARVRLSSLPKDSFDILSYCLMPNHFHFLIKQNSEVSIDKLMLKVCTSYAMYFNRKYAHVGNVFQDTFKAKLVDSDSYVIYLSAYIHNNPANPKDYVYSSFADYISEKSVSDICSTNFLLAYFKNNKEEYKKFVLGFSKVHKSQIKYLLFEDEQQVQQVDESDGQGVPLAIT